MARGSCTFKQRDVSAAVKAVVAAGCSVASVEIDKDGKIVVHTRKQDEAADNDAGGNEWDEA
jgi:hypothetical protein